MCLEIIGIYQTMRKMTINQNVSTGVNELKTGVSLTAKKTPVKKNYSLSIQLQGRKRNISSNSLAVAY